VRCPRCGNENPDINRFCGMCGTTLLATPPAPPQRSATAPEAPSSSTPTPRPQIVERRSESPSARDPEPSSTSSFGTSSFLGLNEPAPSPTRANLALDPQAPAPSGNLDYLLEDEEPKSGGGVKFLLILAALALAVGFGYLRWKNQAFGWLSSTNHKPAASTQENNGADAKTPAAPAMPPAQFDQPVPATPPPVESSSAGTNTSQPPATSMTVPVPSSAAPGSAPNPQNSAPATSPKESDATPAAKTPDQAKPDQSKEDQSKPDQPKEDQPKAEATPTQSEPAAPPKPVDPVAEAQKYLYGRGATQNCDRGLRLLKPAANQSNTKAMIEMGALYSAGLCTPRDLPTAYRWFALALRKDPSNEAVQTDLQKLWGEMTQPERQLAIRLTQ
jgi:hypothetical protein